MWIGFKMAHATGLELIAIEICLMRLKVVMMREAITPKNI